MLSSVFLKFQDPKIHKAYLKEKKIFYNRVMPLITGALIALLIAIEIIYRVAGLGVIEMATTIVNSCAVGWFVVLTILARCSTRVTKLVCPSLIALVFYYMTWIDYDTINVSIYYKTVIGITICFFLLVVFNEAWMTTTFVYTPFAAYFMYKTGQDMLQDSANTGELVARCLFLCFIFGIVAYKMEKLNKQSFLGREASQQVFFKWLKIFDTFPEGLALIRGGEIVYANESLSKLLELHEYVHEDDTSKADLKDYMRETMLTKLDREIVKKISVWDFLEGNINGGAFELDYKTEEGVPERPRKHNFIPQLEGQSLVKYLSLNKVSVSVLGGVSGKREKLFIVRDLTTMVNLQKVMYTRQHLNEFTEKIVREI